MAGIQNNIRNRLDMGNGLLQKIPRIFSRQLLAIATAFILGFYVLHVCAAEPKVIHHSFAFGGYDQKENEDIYILNYRYGDDKTAPTRPAQWQIDNGKIPQMASVSTFSPPANSLYVKWKIISTGKEYEDTVELKKLLPLDISGKTVYFNITGAQLNVYIIEGITSKQLHTNVSADCPIQMYKMFKCTRIYPDHWSNFN